MVNRFERFSSAISEIHKCWHKLAAEEMEKCGLKGPHAFYLATLYRFEDGLTATQLSDLCGKDKSDVSRTVASMEQYGLVIKECNSNNNYRAKIKLTEYGMECAEHVRKLASAAVEMAGGEISDDKRAIFYETLELIADNLKFISEQGLPPVK